MVNHEQYEAQRQNDAAKEVEQSNLNLLLDSDLSLFGATRRQNNDKLVGDSVLPKLDLEIKGDTRVAQADTAKKQAAKETFGVKSEASERTEMAVAKGIESSKLTPEEKKVATTMAKAIAEGDTGKLQKVIDDLGTNKAGREQLKKIVSALNKAYDDGGIRDINLSYPVKDENGTHWELEVSGKTKNGIERYVYIKPGERPVSSTIYGPHGELDRGDSAGVDKMQEKEAAKALRGITEHGQERLAEKERKAKEARQRDFDREIEQLRQEMLRR